MPEFLDQHALETFQRDGFLAFDPKIPAAEIESIRQMLMTLHESDTGFAEGALFDAIGVDDGQQPRRFPQILHPRAFAPGLLQTSFYRNAEAVARQILGEHVRFKADISLLKPARIGAATPWHQDEAFQDPANEYHELSFWLALQPTDRSNSCMEFIPGSHNWPVLPHGFPDGDPRVHALECSTGFDPAEAVPCALPTGGCTIHTQRTMHYAGPNTSERPRLAYVLIFDLLPTPAKAPRSFPWREQHRTARAEREQAWRRRGGLLVHMWRQRHRVRAETLLFDLRRAVSAMRRLHKRPI
ncbi:MAG: phytanoyl-CoA dioxygenase family protein [Rhodospirillales bacterium]|nr:phytanoyl-CoA dioxygenase family protein [Rhodospirillales bacterium]